MRKETAILVSSSSPWDGGLFTCLGFTLTIQSRSPRKCIKIAKTAGNKAFLAVFAVFVVIQLAPSGPARSVASAGVGAPVRLVQGIIKKYAKIKRFYYSKYWSYLVIAFLIVELPPAGIQQKNHCWTFLDRSHNIAFLFQCNCWKGWYTGYRSLNAVFLS